MDRTLNIRKLCEEVSISVGSYQAVITEDLGMRLVIAKFVPLILKLEQKVFWMPRATDLLQGAETDADFW